MNIIILLNFIIYAILNLRYKPTTWRMFHAVSLLTRREQKFIINIKPILIMYFRPLIILKTLDFSVDMNKKCLMYKKNYRTHAM